MPVQQHPIPQNVTQYQFRLVGDMTLKQFLQLAGGILIAVLFYASPLPFFLKWPAIIIFSGLGASLAFLPVEGRPLDQWILAFIRSIYAPTIYTWQKPSSPIPTNNTFPTPSNNDILPVMAKLATTASPSLPITPTPPVVSPPQPSLNPPVPAAAPVVPPTSTLLPPTPPPIPPVSPTPPILPLPNPKPVVVSSPNLISLEKKSPVPQNGSPTPSPTPISAPTQTTARTLTAATPVDTTSSLPIPHPPQTPNTMVGMTLTHEGKILDSAIIEVLLNGATIRATKSNKLGQFLFAKPLDNGIYHVTASKDNTSFPVFELDLKGQIVPPIKLQALA